MCIYICIDIHLFMCLAVPTYAYIYIYIDIDICIYIYTYVYIYTIYICMCICRHLYFTCISILNYCTAKLSRLNSHIPSSLAERLLPNHCYNKRLSAVAPRRRAEPDSPLKELRVKGPDTSLVRNWELKEQNHKLWFLRLNSVAGTLRLRGGGKAPC